MYLINPCYVFYENSKNMDKKSDYLLSIELFKDNHPYLTNFFIGLV